jgi:hypothetical protein
MTPMQKIQELEQELSAAKQAGKLTTDGERVLQSLQSGKSAGSFGAFMQGLSLNLSDEAIGAIRSFVSPVPGEVASHFPGMKPREAGIAMERSALERYKQESPGKAMMSEIAGGIIPGLALPGMSLGRAALAGAGFGAVSGAGEAEGDITERLGGAGVGATLGAVGAPIGQLFGRVAGKATTSLADSMFRTPTRAGVDSARQAVREAIESDVGSLDAALKTVLERSGKPYTLADIGPNTRAYLDAAAQLPGPGKQAADKFLRERDRGMMSRLTSDLQDAFGSRASFFDEFNALKDARSDLGGKLYKRAFRVEVPVNKELTDILRTPTAQAAYERAARIAADRNIPLPKVSITPEGKLVTESGNEVSGINTEFLHFLKMGLDDVVFTGKAPQSGIGSTELAGQKEVRMRLLNMIDRNNPSYARARSYWAGETAVMDAMTEGRKIMSSAPQTIAKQIDEITGDVRKMSGSEKEAFRLGAMQGLLDRMGGEQVGETVLGGTMADAKKLLDRRTLKAIELTFPNTKLGKESYDKFVDNLTRELEMKITSQQVTAGSQTAGRQAAMGRIRGEAARELPTSTTVAGIVANALRRDMGALEEQQVQSASNEIARMLIQQSPQEIEKIIRDLQGRNAMDVLRQRVPQIIGAIGRAPVSPFAAGQLGGSMSDTGAVQNILPSGLLMGP